MHSKRGALTHSDLLPIYYRSSYTFSLTRLLNGLIGQATGIVYAKMLGTPRQAAGSLPLGLLALYSSCCSSDCLRFQHRQTDRRSCRASEGSSLRLHLAVPD